MAGEAPGVPSSSMIIGAVGEQLEQRLALLLAADHVVGADVGQRWSTPLTVRSMVTTGMPASTASCTAGAMPSAVMRADEDAV